MKQTTLGLNSGNGFERHGKATRRTMFLDRMETLMPWAELVALIEPHYPKPGNGRPPIGLERMLRMYCIANWFNLADEACEDALYDVALFRQFCRMDLGAERIADATTLLKFRRLLETHKLGEKVFARVGELLLANGLKLSGGTIVDATIIAAPSSTKNAEGKRDEEMHQTKKGNEWHFGMKMHIGADSAAGVIHSATVTAANVHDSKQLDQLLHGGETRVYGDSAYRGHKVVLAEVAPRAKDFTNKRAYKNKPLTEAEERANTKKSSVRSKIEHPFRMLKGVWGFAKVRYRGLFKNANRAFVMLAMFNVHKWNRPLTGKVCPA